MLLREATGLEVEDILAMGFLFRAHVLGWNKDKAYGFPVDSGSDLPEAKRSSFLAQTASTQEVLRAALQARRSRADFLPIQERPILRLPAGLLVLDERYLWDRVTRGLFWMVHDHERDPSRRRRPGNCWILGAWQA